MMRNFSQQFKEQAKAQVLDQPQEPVKALAQSLGVATPRWMSGSESTSGP